MFENIISAPMFFQLPVFGIVLAMILYQMEYVGYIWAIYTCILIWWWWWKDFSIEHVTISVENVPKICFFAEFHRFLASVVN